MNNDFPLPEGLFGRFGVVKLWPGIKTAEDECIARLKLAAKAIGVECVEILADGGFVSAPDIKASKANVDFVIHLHYDTPSDASIQARPKDSTISGAITSGRKTTVQGMVP